MVKKKIDYSELINLAILIDENINQVEITEIIDELKSISSELNFVSLSKTETNTNLNLDLRPKDFNEILKVTDLIKKKFKKSKTIIARNSNLSL